MWIQHRREIEAKRSEAQAETERLASSHALAAAAARGIVGPAANAAAAATAAAAAAVKKKKHVNKNSWQNTSARANYTEDDD